MRQTITAVILTRNEADQIEQCLDSIRWVDEVIVVDGQSTDETPEICRRRGAKVISHAFNGSFAEERNLGADQATQDWVLQLDADDRVTPEFRTAAEALLKNGTPHAAYRFRRKNFFLGHPMRRGGWTHYSLHFFRRGKARYRGRVHEELVVEGSIGTLEASIDHHPFQSIEEFIDRQNRYTTLEALDLLDKRGRVSEREIRYQIMIRPAKLFWKMYVKKGGFLEGMHGLIFSGLFSFVHFLRWAKLWELAQENQALTP